MLAHYPGSMVRAPHPVRDVAGLLALLVADPGRPRLTWYGEAGERVELSGAVLDNWVSKTTNLLVEEHDAGPGTRVLVDLPAHWRTAVWALAAWRTGATVVLAAPADDTVEGCDLVVTSRPGAWAGSPVASGADLVVVSLPALARRYDGDLPPGATDAASAVMTYADQILWSPEPDPASPALDAGGTVAVTHGDLLPGTTPDGRRPRVLVDGRGDVAAVLADLLAVWAQDGSVVLTAATTAAELDADPARRARLAATERVAGHA